MTLYYGDDYLPLGQKPPLLGDSSIGVFFALEASFVEPLGKIHCYEIEDSLIFDLRNKSHRNKLKVNHDFWKLHEDSILSGLPAAFSFNHSDELENILKPLIKSLGFSGWVLIETEWPGNPLTVEVWDLEQVSLKD